MALWPLRRFSRAVAPSKPLVVVVLLVWTTRLDEFARSCRMPNSQAAMATTMHPRTVSLTNLSPFYKIAKPPSLPNPLGQPVCASLTNSILNSCCSLRLLAFVTKFPNVLEKFIDSFEGDLGRQKAGNAQGISHLTETGQVRHVRVIGNAANHIDTPIQEPPESLKFQACLAHLKSPLPRHK